MKLASQFRTGDAATSPHEVRHHVHFDQLDSDLPCMTVRHDPKVGIFALSVRRMWVLHMLESTSVAVSQN